MAQITKSIRAAHGLTAGLIPADILKSIGQGELLDRIVAAKSLVRKSQAASDPTLRKGYAALARATLTAQPRAKTERQAAEFIAKAAGCPNTRQADALRRQAQELYERHPVAQGARMTRRWSKPRPGTLAWSPYSGTDSAPGSSRGHSAAGLGAEPVSWSALAQAVGLLTSRGMVCPAGVSRAGLFDNCEPGEIFAALEFLATVFLELLAPEDKGARILAALGLLALTEETRHDGT